MTTKKEALELRYLEEYQEDPKQEERKEAIQKLTDKQREGIRIDFGDLWFLTGTIAGKYIYSNFSSYRDDDYIEKVDMEGDFLFGDKDTVKTPITLKEMALLFDIASEANAKKEQYESDNPEVSVYIRSVDISDVDKTDFLASVKKKVLEDLEAAFLEAKQKFENKKIEEALEKKKLAEELKQQKEGVLVTEYVNITKGKVVSFNKKTLPAITFKDTLPIKDKQIYLTKDADGEWDRSEWLSSYSTGSVDNWINWGLMLKNDFSFDDKDGMKLSITFENNHIYLNKILLPKQFAKRVIDQCYTGGMKSDANISNMISVYRKLGVRKLRLCTMEKVNFRGLAGKDDIDLPVSFKPTNDETKAEMIINGESFTVDWEMVMHYWCYGNDPVSTIWSLDKFTNMGIPRADILRVLKEFMLVRNL